MWHPGRPTNSNPHEIYPKKKTYFKPPTKPAMMNECHEGKNRETINQWRKYPSQLCWLLNEAARRGAVRRQLRRPSVKKFVDFVRIGLRLGIFHFAYFSFPVTCQSVWGVGTIHENRNLCPSKKKSREKIWFWDTRLDSSLLHLVRDGWSFDDGLTRFCGGARWNESDS